MADIPGAVLVEPGTRAQAIPQAGAQPEQDAGIRFKRNFFLDTDDIGPEIRHRGPRRGRESGKTTSEYIEFSDGVKERYRRFLDNQLQKLTDLHNTNPDLYNQIISTPNHVHERRLINELTSNKSDLRTGEEILSVDGKKLEAFLDTAEGMVLANEFLEYQTALKLFALGLHGANLPPGERQALADPMQIRLNFNQGVLNRFFHENVQPHLGLIAGVAGSVDLGLLGGVLSQGPMGAAIGLVPPAVYGMYRTVQSLRREGTILDLRQCSAAFQVINGNPVERAYVKAVMGIDTENYEDLGGNHIVLRGTRSPEITQNAHELEYQVLQALYTRQQYYETLGVPRERLDALPQQFLYAYLAGAGEQTGTKVAKRVERYFDPNHAGILDGAGNPQEILVAGVSMPNPAYNPGLHGMDFQGNIRRHLEAQRRVMVEDVGLFVRGELDQKEARNKVIGTIAERKQQLGEGGEIRRRSIEEINKRKALLENTRSLVDEERARAEQYRQNIVKRQAEIEQAAVSAQAKLQETLDAVQQPGGAGPFGNPAAALAALNAILTTNATEIVINGVSIRSTIQRSTNAETALTAALVGATPQERSLERQQRDAAFTRDIERINADVATVRAMIANIENAMRSPQVALPAELADTDENVLKVGSDLAQMQAAFTDVTSWNGIGGVSLTEADLRDPAISFDQLLERINTANGTNPAVGWSREHNSIPQIRLRLAHAMIEARARALATGPLTAPGLTFNELIGGWEVTEHQLLTLTGDQINQLLTARRTVNPVRYGAPLTIFPATTIEMAKATARERLGARSQAMAEMEALLKTQVELATKATAEIDFKEQDQTLSAAENLLRREANGTLINGTNVVYDNRLDYADGALVGGNMNYTEAERTLNLPRGYYELLDVLFDYKTQTQLPREEYFRTLNRILPPDQLSQYLSDTLMLGTGPNLDLTLTQMRLRMDPADGRLDPYQLGRAFRRISYELGQRALAI